MKALRFFLIFGFGVVLILVASIGFEEKEAYANEVTTVNVKGSFDYTSVATYVRPNIDGYTYTIDYDIQAKVLIDTTLGKPGMVGLTWDVSGSTMTITNTTPGKAAPDTAIWMMPYYDMTAARAVYGATYRLDGGYGYDFKYDSSDFPPYIIGYAVGDDEVDSSPVLPSLEEGAWANYSANTSKDGMIGVGGSATYRLEFDYGRSTTKTWIVRGDAVDFYTNPIGLYFSSFHIPGAKHGALIPESYTVDFGGQKSDLLFSDSYFSAASSEYNHTLTTLAMGLCATTYSGTTENCYTDLGFTDYRVYELEDNPNPNDTIKAHFARKGLDDGTELISVTLCGTQGQEWQQYLEYFIDRNKLRNGVFENFQLAQANLHLMLSEYCGGDLSGKKFLITGHSRGAAVGNLEALVLNEMVGAENVYCYTFATPNTHLEGAAPPEASNIFNVVDAVDIVPQLPLGSKAGQTYGYHTIEGALANLAGLNKLVVGVAQHTPENYMRLIKEAEPSQQFSYQAWNWIGVHCPTDLVVKDSDGAVVASITDNIVSGDNQYLILTNDAAEKTLLLPQGEEFRIEVTGTADGSMEYSASTLTNGELITSVEPTVVDFSTGDKFVIDIDSDSLSTSAPKPMSALESLAGEVPDTIILGVFVGVGAVLVIIILLYFHARDRLRKRQ